MCAGGLKVEVGLFKILFFHFFLCLPPQPMCTSSASSELNRLLLNDTDSNAPIMVIVYGPYMN
jgi:hypothetical protein